MTEFTPLTSLVGGVLIGVASLLMLASQGRIAGISGILGGVLGGPDRPWRMSFVLGLLAGGLGVAALAPEAFGSGSPTGTVGLVAAGLLVGIGTRLGSGCTSGHGVCGMSRLSTRSFVATGTFMLVAGITVYVAMHVVGLGGGAS